MTYLSFLKLKTMKKNYVLLISLCLTLPILSQVQSITISPISLFGARINLRYEKLTDKKLTYGARTEFSTAFRTLMLIPYGRIYPFSKENKGLYSELGIGYRGTYFKDFHDPTINFTKSAPVCRFMLGGQFFAGKKDNIPFDFGLGINIDPIVFANVEETDGGSVFLGLLGPFSMINFRIQTGLAFGK